MSDTPVVPPQPGRPDRPTGGGQAPSTGPVLPTAAPLPPSASPPPAPTGPVGNGPDAADLVLDWVLRVGAVGVAVSMAAGSAITAAFLSPVRIGTTLVPVSWLVVALGVIASVAVARIGSGTRGATVFPALAWFATVAPLTSRTDAGDVAIPGTWVGYGVLFVGALTIAASVFVASVAHRWLGRVGVPGPS